MNRTLVVIPTKGRPLEAASVIALCLRQTVPPSAVLVVDASDREDLAELARRIVALGPAAEGLVEHLPARRASAPGQRNEGIERALRHDDWTCLQFLDDDVEVEPGFLARSMAGLYSGDWGGVCGVTADGAAARPWGRRLFESVFCLQPGPPGTVTRAGRNAPYAYDPDRSGVVRTQWLLGVSMFRREVVQSVRYWDAQEGYVLFDDVEFSVRVARRWPIGAMPSLRIDHRELSRRTPDPERSAFQMTYNRYRVLRSAQRPAGVAFYWSVVGLLLRAGASALLGRRSGRERARGVLAGLRAIRGDRDDS